MTGWTVGALLALAGILLAGDVSRLPGKHRPAGVFAQSQGTKQSAGGKQKPRQGSRFRTKIRRARSSRDDELHRFPLLVQQLAGLLSAGRTPRELWADAARLSRQDELIDGEGSQAAVILEAAARAAALGMSPVPVFQRAAEQAAAEDPFVAMVWQDLAACVDASERSGAPLAGILARYGRELEAALDSTAARATAMSGPKATMKLLTWLPAAGLLMGYLLGGNPLAVLAGGPLGWATAVTGLGMALGARVWSRALVRRAAGSAGGR